MSASVEGRPEVDVARWERRCRAAEDRARRRATNRAEIRVDAQEIRDLLAALAAAQARADLNARAVNENADSIVRLRQELRAHKEATRQLRQLRDDLTQVAQVAGLDSVTADFLFKLNRVIDEKCGVVALAGDAARPDPEASDERRWESLDGYLDNLPTDEEQRALDYGEVD